ncbi:MAG: putative addiction module antidote protein [Dehalococcoidia bacterium]|nr:putative addiction module antidote protein [Chloroflexota bacterium]MXW26576.1 putative addiction module antidote protein [Dehalococcoidia bacterium]MXZ87245.1 putative addiction module antidote protein [Dehalococcoidia bacterium]MYA53009.1 putative addiction module antidote protein [Dehalococcoidia bacterium]MYI86012.1 putative addiction module antidote protein [Dehalococcoidia bacterium]
MPKMDFKPWPVDDAAAALNAALATDDLSRVMATLGTIARAKSMRQVAADTGLGRESLYKSLAPTGRPEFATVLKVLAALGLRLCVVPIEDAR